MLIIHKVHFVALWTLIRLFSKWEINGEGHVGVDMKYLLISYIVSLIDYMLDLIDDLE